MRAPVKSIELGGLTNLAVLAPIKPGFVDGFETITYLERLRKLLNAMHASRVNLRESEMHSPVFPDTVGRWGIIRGFRYAIVPPRIAQARTGEPGTSMLSLNVTFDGGWEPYMRVIYRDIGTLLDALFCHCVGYPGSRKGNFDEYCRWVRDNEMDAGIFYADSSVTMADQRYLSDIERLQREGRDPDDPEKRATPERLDVAIARHAMKPAPKQAAESVAEALADPQVRLALPLRSLKGLFRLATYFPIDPQEPDGGDGGVLVRFAQSALQEFRQALKGLNATLLPIWPKLQEALGDELAWLDKSFEPPRPDPHLTYDESVLQGAVYVQNDPVTHGCVVMLGVRDAAKAARYIAEQLADRCAAPAQASEVRYHLAFSHAGLAALELPAEWLDRLPQEFAEGMEARCGLLGDVRGNHPDHWLRPLRDETKPERGRIDLATVHAVLVLRLIDAKGPSATLHPTLAGIVATLADDKNDPDGSGLSVLAVQPTRSYRDEKTGEIRGHFGFADGLSQPRFVAGTPKPGTDEVRAGELLLGHANDRGDDRFAWHAADALLDNGSFLVMRKLQQRVDHLDDALKAREDKAAVLAKMMGRDQQGKAFVPAGKGGPNDFNYEDDPHGVACPFHSHIRRANPRDGRVPMPRIQRRGMSYGPLSDTDRTTERGLVFMGYCASIAEQYETIQRWMAGGNSSGVSSSQADPFLAVPQPGERRTFRYLKTRDEVDRVDLGDKPFVELAWGLYLFAPSLPALRGLPGFRRPTAAARAAYGARGRAAAGPGPAAELPLPVAAEAEAPSTVESWRLRLEDPDRNKALWAEVREAHDGLLNAAPYATLLGSPARVVAALQDEGTNFSVQGYGKRMAASVGPNHLGMDPSTGHDALASLVNEAIEKYPAARAFEEARPVVRAVLDGFVKLLKQPDPPGEPERIAIDLVTLSESVLAGLCSAWIGLPEARGPRPDGAPNSVVPAGKQRLMAAGGRLDGNVQPPRCPGHLLTPSRFIFSPHPRPEAVKDGPLQGQAVLKAVQQMLDERRWLGPLAADIQKGLAHRGGKIVADAIAGVLLGFPPTVHGNFLRTMESWIDDKALWHWQQRLAETETAVPDPFQRAEQVLFEPLMQTMRKRPVPEMLWRCPVRDGQVVFDEKQRVVLGIASALTDPAVGHELMFGGSRDPDSEIWGLHACPGYGMGVGVMLALIAGLLEAGSLQPTGSPVLLMLTPRPPAAAPAAPAAAAPAASTGSAPRRAAAYVGGAARRARKRSA
ncbi:hypothetical protein [Aquabacterium sp.]|uniref:hypothetical protein n=1 Tax=Aquabacterium sp. TaxID=1872578 RepID=UPI002BD98193|nr:hypothetical protein [Aquabacterium sp.]HSW03100.1 hypothetical protein [Aquabacterium sp.]